MSYKTHGGTCSGMGQGHMGGAPGSYIKLGMGKKPSGSAQRKSGSMGKRSRGNSPGPGAGHQRMGPNPKAKKGMMGMGRDGY